MKFIRHVNDYQNKFLPTFDVTTIFELKPGTDDGTNITLLK